MAYMLLCCWKITHSLTVARNFATDRFQNSLTVTVVAAFWLTAANAPVFFTPPYTITIEDNNGAINSQSTNCQQGLLRCLVGGVHGLRAVWRVNVHLTSLHYHSAATAQASTGIFGAAPSKAQYGRSAIGTIHLAIWQSTLRSTNPSAHQAPMHLTLIALFHFV